MVLLTCFGHTQPLVQEVDIVAPWGFGAAVVSPSNLIHSACYMEWSHGSNVMIGRTHYWTWLRLAYVTVISNSPDSCCTSSHTARYSISAWLKPAQVTVLLMLTLALLALQKSLIYHREWFWEKQLSQNRAQQITTHACGGRGGMARRVRCSIRLPEVDRIGIRGWREAEVTCWSYDWERCERNKNEKQLFPSFFLCLVFCRHTASAVQWSMF